MFASTIDPAVRLAFAGGSFFRLTSRVERKPDHEQASKFKTLPNAELLCS
jgi:hypothetical protein